MLAKHLFDGKGRVYICGNIGMSKSCEQIIKQVIKAHKSLDEKQTEDEFFKLQDQKRLCIEAWG